MQPSPPEGQARKSALLLGAVAVGWWIGVLLGAFYLRDMTVQAVGVGVYLPDQLAWIGLAPAWVPGVPALVSSLAALAALQSAGASAAALFRLLTITSFALLVAYAFSILAILYYVSITPT